MRLTGLSAGYAIPQVDFDAVIHSFFPAAVNLRPVDGDALLTLVGVIEADLPQGIGLDTPPGFSFERLIVGGGVSCRDSTLFFESSTLVVEFRQAKRWQCDLPALGTDLGRPAVAEAWKCVWQALNERQARLGAELVASALQGPGGIAQSAVSRRARETIHALINATRKAQLDDLSPLTPLIGLGSGLTPCGDDFLVGYLAGLWCRVRDFTERKKFISKLGQAVIHLSRQTNDISRTYLYHAAHGQVSSRLDALAVAISMPSNPEKLLPIAEFAMQSGHTSGMDAVTGLLYGLAAWEGGLV